MIIKLTGMLEADYLKIKELYRLREKDVDKLVGLGALEDDLVMTSLITTWKIVHSKSPCDHGEGLSPMILLLGGVFGGFVASALIVVLGLLVVNVV